MNGRGAGADADHVKFVISQGENCLIYLNWDIMVRKSGKNRENC